MKQNDQPAMDITPTTDSDLIHIIYGQAPVLILAANETDLALQLERLTGIAYILFDEADARLISPAKRSITLGQLPAPPTCPCLVIAAPSGTDRFGRLIDWWREMGHSAAPLIEHKNEASIEYTATLLLRRILASILECDRNAAERTLALHDQILTLRERVEDAEALISHLKTLIPATAPSLVVACDPSRDTWDPLTDGPADFRFSFPIRGLSQIDLHFQQNGDGLGRLDISLSIIDNDALIGSWSVPYYDVKGWVACRFPHALSASGHFLALSLSWHTEAGVPPHLSISDITAQLCGEMTIDHETESARLPGIRLYRDIPGTAHLASYWTMSQER